MKHAAFKISVPILILFLFALTFNSCKKDNYKLTNQGKIICYTNAQAMLNCGPFEVTIYIDGDPIGKISDPYTGDIKPTSQESNSFVLIIDKNPGTYTYSAKFNCGETIGTWDDQVQVVAGTPAYVFLDISKCNITN